MLQKSLTDRLTDRQSDGNIKKVRAYLDALMNAQNSQTHESMKLIPMNKVLPQKLYNTLKHRKITNKMYRQGLNRRWWWGGLRTETYQNLTKSLNFFIDMYSHTNTYKITCIR